MSCSRYQLFLSMHLDGRLSSAKRDLLLDHLDGCTACATLSDELSSARDLALQLPGEYASPDFQSTLWERVQAGEGTPEAVFRDPVPWGARLRYVGTGAAAAALFLFAMNWIGPANDSTGPGANDDSNSIASVSPPPPNASPEKAGATNTGLRPRTSPSHPDIATVPATARAANFAVRPASHLQPAEIAGRVQRETLRQINDLQQRVPALTARLTSQTMPKIRGSIENQVRDLRTATQTLSWLAAREIIELPKNLQDELLRAERGTRLVQRANDSRELRIALEQVAGISPEKLESRFKILCCDTQQRLNDCMFELIYENPAAGCLLELNPSQPDSIWLSGPASGQFQFFRIEFEQR